MAHVITLDPSAGTSFSPYTEQEVSNTQQEGAGHEREQGLANTPGQFDRNAPHTAAHGQ